MIHHIVMWKLKASANGLTKIENALKIKVGLELLKDEISAIKEISVGIDIDNNDSNFDVVLLTKFDSIEGLQNYQVHPKHKEIGKWLKTVVEGRACVDYEA